MIRRWKSYFGDDDISTCGTLPGTTLGSRGVMATAMAALLMGPGMRVALMMNGKTE